MNRYKKIKKRGFGLLEAIVAMSIFVMIATTVTTTLLQSFSANSLSDNYRKANLIAQEGLEAVRSIRNQDWNNLSVGSVSCPASFNAGVEVVGSVWQFGVAPDVIGKFDRTITVANVCRDVSGNMVTDAGVYDSGAKKVTSTVSWLVSSSRQKSVSVSTYFTDFVRDIPPTTTPIPTPTFTPTPTLTPVPTPTPTPIQYNSCNDYCKGRPGKDYEGGNCRVDPFVCPFFKEVYESGGNQYCPTWLWFQDTCCCEID